MSYIYLIRHGEAAASWQENPDPGLSGLGREQAQQLAVEAEALSINSILCSPMRRARETAAPLAGLRSIPVEIVESFREIPTPPDITLETRLDWLRQSARLSWQEVDPLLVQWRSNLLQSLHSLENDVAIFTHFRVMNAVVGYLGGRDELVSYQPTYCSVLILERAPSGLKILDRGQQSVSRVL